MASMMTTVISHTSKKQSMLYSSYSCIIITYLRRVRCVITTWEMCNNYVRDELVNNSVVYLLFDLKVPTLLWSKLSSEVGLLILINPYIVSHMGFYCGNIFINQTLPCLNKWRRTCTAFKLTHLTLLTKRIKKKNLPTVAINNYVIKGSEKKNTQTALECLLWSKVQYKPA